MTTCVSQGERCVLEENLYTEFRMDFKFSSFEMSRIPKSTDSSGPITPASKTISAFLNTKGGSIYIGIDSQGRILGVQLTSSTKGHVLLSLSVCLSRFHPPVPPELVRVHFVELAESKPNGNSAAVLPSLKQMDEDPGHDCDSTADSEPDKGPSSHLIGNVRCPCEDTNASMSSKLYLVVVEVYQSDDGTIYANEEGLAYRRRHGSNKMLVINDIATLMKKAPKPPHLEYIN